MTFRLRNDVILAAFVTWFIPVTVYTNVSLTSDGSGLGMAFVHVGRGRRNCMLEGVPNALRMEVCSDQLDFRKMVEILNERIQQDISLKK
ncbi:hypothetical protein BJ508DRAFT_412327, partial [Ascobolus immersus RN42]